MTTTKSSLFRSGGGEDPLAQLDLYVKSKSDVADDCDELLSVAEFLFGQKSLSSALSIVDSRHSLITKLVAPSGRFVYVIRSSTTMGGASLQHHAPNPILETLRENKKDNYYLCLMSPSQSSQSPPPVRYCSCRSFLEKSTKKAAFVASSLRSNSSTGYNQNNIYTHDENDREGAPICKHLLALWLLPHLVASSAMTPNGPTGQQPPPRTTEQYYCCPEIKSVTEEDFANLILDRVL